MNNKTTLLLSGVVIVIIAIIGVGFVMSPRQTTAPHQSIDVSTTNTKTGLTREQLAKKLLDEQPLIHDVLTHEFPSLTTLYDIERETLYSDGSWYGSILQYKGDDINNRDTLRVVLQKKGGVWTVRTSPPQIIISLHSIPDAPHDMIDDINRPATLIGAGESPTITPDE
ncbi:MAG: hypothetical protein WAS27_02210 [Candidatus Saccharimonadales bacterium]